MRTLETLNIKKLASLDSYGNELYIGFFLMHTNQLKQWTEEEKKNHRLTYRKSQENCIVIP